MQMTGVNQRAMANIDMIANDRWIVAAVDMDTAIILNIGSVANGDEIIIAAQRHLMPDRAVFANANRANNGGGLGDIGAVINFGVMIQKRGDIGILASHAVILCEWGIMVMIKRSCDANLAC